MLFNVYYVFTQWEFGAKIGYDVFRGHTKRKLTQWVVAKQIYVLILKNTQRKSIENYIYVLKFHLAGELYPIKYYRHVSTFVRIKLKAYLNALLFLLSNSKNMLLDKMKNNNKCIWIKSITLNL